MPKKYLKNEKGIVRAVTTDNLQLEKPLLNENYDIDVHNRNMDKIDNAIQDVKGKVEGLELKAEKVTLADKSNKFTATNVEDALLENKTSILENKNKIENLKLSVVDGKTKVASAISDKGVPTLATDTFQIMHDNIKKINNVGIFLCESLPSSAIDDTLAIITDNVNSKTVVSYNKSDSILCENGDFFIEIIKQSDDPRKMTIDINQTDNVINIQFIDIYIKNNNDLIRYDNWYIRKNGKWIKRELIDVEFITPNNSFLGSDWLITPKKSTPTKINTKTDRGFTANYPYESLGTTIEEKIYNNTSLNLSDLSELYVSFDYKRNSLAGTGICSMYFCIFDSYYSNVVKLSISPGTVSHIIDVSALNGNYYVGIFSSYIEKSQTYSISFSSIIGKKIRLSEVSEIENIR